MPTTVPTRIANFWFGDRSSSQVDRQTFIDTYGPLPADVSIPDNTTYQQRWMGVSGALTGVSYPESLALYSRTAVGQIRQVSADVLRTGSSGNYSITPGDAGFWAKLIADNLSGDDLTMTIYHDHEVPSRDSFDPNDKTAQQIDDAKQLWRARFAAVRAHLPNAPQGMYGQFGAFLGFQGSTLAVGSDNFNAWEKAIKDDYGPYFETDGPDWIGAGMYWYTSGAKTFDEYMTRVVAKLTLAKMYGLPVYAFLSEYQAGIWSDYRILNRQQYDYLGKTIEDLGCRRIPWVNRYVGSLDPDSYDGTDIAVDFEARRNLGVPASTYIGRSIA